MKKLIGTVFLLAACHKAPAPTTTPAPQPAPVTVPAPPPSLNQPGAGSAVDALTSFLRAVKNQDLQALSVIWGTASGPARNDMGRDELEKREIYMMRCLGHDSFQILGEAPGTAGNRVFAVQLRRGDLTRSTNFYAVPSSGGRWYILDVDVTVLQDLCVR